MNAPRALTAGDMDSCLRQYLEHAPPEVVSFCEADANVVRVLTGVPEQTIRPHEPLVSDNGVIVAGLAMVSGGLAIVYWDRERGWWSVDISCHRIPNPIPVTVPTAEDPEF